MSYYVDPLTLQSDAIVDIEYFRTRPVMPGNDGKWQRQKVDETVEKIFSKDYGSDAAAWAQVFALGFIPQNEMETVYVMYEKGKSGDVHVWNAYYRRVQSIAQKNYWHTLDMTADPIQYLKLLSLYKAGNVTLKPFNYNYIPSNILENQGADFRKCNNIMEVLQSPYAWKMVAGWSRNPYAIPLTQSSPSNSVMLTPFDNFQRDRITYTDYLNRFREKLSWTYLTETFDILEIARVSTDVSDLTNINNYVVNTILPRMQANVGTEQIINLSYNGKIVDRISTIIPDNFIDGPLIPFPDGKQLTCQAALQRIIIEEITGKIIANLPKLQATLIQVSDQDRTEILREPDPFKNPYLVYDPVESEKANVPVFKNTAVNLNVPDEDIRTVILPQDLQKLYPTVEQFEKVPELHAATVRNLLTESGAAYSLNDLYNTEKKNNIAPWLLAGAAAALAIGQFTA